MLARKIILGFGFAALLPLLIHAGIDVYAPYPNSHDQSWSAELDEREEGISATEKARRHMLRQQHDAAFQSQRDQAERVHFFVGAPLGVVVTLLGSFVRAQAIGGGLMLGGIFTFTSGCVYYWADLSRGGRFAVLLVAFAVLLWIGYQRLSELKQPPKSS